MYVWRRLSVPAAHRDALTPVTQRAMLLQGHDEIVWAVEVQGPRLYSASADKTIRVWDIESRRCERVSSAFVGCAAGCLAIRPSTSLQCLWEGAAQCCRCQLTEMRMPQQVLQLQLTAGAVRSSCRLPVCACHTHEHFLGLLRSFSLTASNQGRQESLQEAAGAAPSWQQRAKAALHSALRSCPPCSRPGLGI